MRINKGDLVTRNSYNNDTIFKVINIRDNIYYLKGFDVRLYADSPENDLIKVDNMTKHVDVKPDIPLDRGDYFYMPARILHLDGDNDYLKRCLKYYQEAGVMAVGKKINESELAMNMERLLKDYQPDIVIITGHDAYYHKKGDEKNIHNYKNSINFIKAVKVARNYEKSHEKLVIIAGACQSNYEELIKAGANFASSPKRINIHALDPAIIAVNIALTERNKEIDLIDILSKTKYGSNGMGGIKSNGLMYVGFPR